MRKSPVRKGKYFLIAFSLLFFLGGKPVEFGLEGTFFHGFIIQNPVIRIGLAINLGEATIRASSGMKIYEVSLDYKLLAEDASEALIKGHKEKLTEKFIVQLAQTREKKEAENFAESLREKIQSRIFITEEISAEQSGKVYVVEAGDFLTRGEALAFIKELSQKGIKDAWILREEISQEGSAPSWILVNDELLRLSENTILYFIPGHQQSFLSFNGQKYRGIFILKSSLKGLVLINILNLEDYLKGVVPSELSPYNFGELEALKAQAVAARTYAIKNLGMNRDLGFDLCDTAKCQVYGGLSVEHPLSNLAVEETKGEVAVYKGELINALYTSTCGGMTENTENIFEGRPVPYLESTECIYEKNQELILENKNIRLPIQIRGRNIAWEVSYLVSLGAIPEESNPESFRKEATWDEALGWISEAQDVVGKKQEKLNPKEGTVLNFLALAGLLIRAFDWQDRIDNLLLKSEVDYILKEFPPVHEYERNELAYLILNGIYPNSSEIANRDRLVRWAELALVLYKIISNHKDFLHRGIFKGSNKNEFEFFEDFETKKLTLSPDAYFFRNQDGERSVASRLSLLGGEEARWLENKGEIKLLEFVFPPNTNVLDRTSPVHRWQVRVSCGELEKRLNQYYPIGSLVDIHVRKRGESKRVVELQLTGTESQVIVRGLKIRWALGLKDTLFSIDREHEEGGLVSHFIFSGKGWGHGVGLCQVGAYGMALQGARYKEILKKYYHGIKVEKKF